MDKDSEEYYISVRDELRKESQALKIEFLDKYLEQIEIHLRDATIQVDMDTIYIDTPSNLWTYEMQLIYTDARNNYTKLQLVESYCPKE